MRIKYLPILLLTLVGFQSVGCGQTNVKSQSNEAKTTETKTALSKEIKIPAGVKKASYEENPAQNGLLLILNSDKQIYYQDKLINNSTLRDVLKVAAAKTKKLSKTKKPSYTLEDENVNRIYLKADSGVPFSEVIKVLKTVQESSPNEYRAKLIVNPAEEVGEFAKTPNGRYVLSFDLGLPANPKTVQKPNPLMLVAKLDAEGKIILNYEPPMKISELKPFLSNIFKDREENGVFAEGTNEVAKKIILVSEPDVKYGDVVKFIDELYETGANPVVFGELSDEYQSLSMK